MKKVFLVFTALLGLLFFSCGQNQNSGTGICIVIPGNKTTSRAAESGASFIYEVNIVPMIRKYVEKEGGIGEYIYMPDEGSAQTKTARSGDVVIFDNITPGYYSVECEVFSADHLICYYDGYCEKVLAKEGEQTPVTIKLESRVNSYMITWNGSEYKYRSQNDLENPLELDEAPVDFCLTPYGEILSFTQNGDKMVSFSVIDIEGDSSTLSNTVNEGYYFDMISAAIGVSGHLYYLFPSELSKKIVEVNRYGNTQRTISLEADEGFLAEAGEGNPALDFIVNKGIIYIAGATSTGEYPNTIETLMISAYKIDRGDEIDTLSFIKSYEIEKGTNSSGVGEVKDMLVQNGYLYVLVSSFNQDFLQKNYGKVLQFKINSDGALKLMGQIGQAPKTTIQNIPFTKNSEFVYADEARTTKKYSDKSYEVSVVVAKTEQEKAVSNKYLLGPQKFIAIKPKKLIIADSGFFLYGDDGDYTALNSHRVVYVDLDNFSISKEELWDNPKFGNDFSTSYTKTMEETVGVAGDAWYNSAGEWFKSTDSTFNPGFKVSGYGEQY